MSHSQEIQYVLPDAQGIARCPFADCGIPVKIVRAPGILFRRTPGCSHIVDVQACGGQFRIGYFDNDQEE